MARVRMRSFNRGLWLNVAADAIPDGGARRAKNIDPVKSFSVRSRKGQTLVLAQIAKALYRFVDARYAHVGTELLRNGVAITPLTVGPLDGEFGSFAAADRLKFANMQAGEAIKDFLFVANGGDIFELNGVVGLPAQLAKIDSTGEASRWGISNTRAGVVSGVGTTNHGAGALAAGVYKYLPTFKNATTGQESNPAGADLEVTIDPADAPADIQVQTTIPVDPQITHTVWYRTVTDGATKFKSGEVLLGAQYTDVIPNESLGDELRFDNDHPLITFRDCVGPHAGRMWWSRIDTDGQRGRVIFSPIGRPESTGGGFLDLASDDENIQRIIVWNGALWVFSEKWMYQVLGTDEPFRFREIQGAPGTIAPESVVPTPFGLIWLAQDGLRIFDGAQSRLLGFDALGRAFRGETLNGHAAFDAGEPQAVFVRNEYIISNQTLTYALDLKTETWREIGVGFNAFYWEPDTDKLLAATAATVVVHEDEGVFADAGVAIAFELETRHILVDGGQTGFVQRVYLDADLAGQTLTPTLLLDGVAVAKTAVTNVARGNIEIPVGRQTREVGVRLTGNVTAQVEVFGIELDVRPSALVK